MNEKFFTLSPEKQARITNAALEVFARNDYKHASTDDIAAKAGISKGLLFYYFRNKQSLYLYLYDYALEQVRGQVLRQKLDGVVERFLKIIQGAALMSDVTFDIKEGDRLANKIPVLKLNDLLMENARLVGAPRISPPREKTGSSDFSNVMYQLPGSCIRVAMVPAGTSSHSIEFLNAGKTDEAHEAVMVAAKVLAGTGLDLIEDEAKLAAIQEEFHQNQAVHN